MQLILILTALNVFIITYTCKTKVLTKNTIGNYTQINASIQCTQYGKNVHFCLVIKLLFPNVYTV